MAWHNVKLWQATWESELQSIINQDTLSKLVIISEGYNAIIIKNFRDVKYVEDDNVARYKAYWVAQGLTMIYRADYEETFVLCISYDAICIFLAVAAKDIGKIYQVNIITAFLAGKLNDVIYL